MLDRGTLFSLFLRGSVGRSARQTDHHSSFKLDLSRRMQGDRVVDMLREGSRNARNLAPRFSTDEESFSPGKALTRFLAPLQWRERASTRHAGRGYSDKKFDPHRIFHRVSISSPRLSIGICTTKWLSVMTMKPPMTPEMELDCGES